MRSKLPLFIGVILGSAHFALVGIPFIQSSGGGESVAYLIVFLDFPLYIAAEALFQRLLLSSVPFNFFWFVVLGTVIYALLGYLLGRIFAGNLDRTNSETKDPGER